MAAQDLKITYLAFAVVLPKADGYGFSGYDTENDILDRHPEIAGHKDESWERWFLVDDGFPDFRIQVYKAKTQEQFFVSQKIKRPLRRCIVSMHHILCKHLVILWESRRRTEGSAESKTHLHPPRSGVCIFVSKPIVECICERVCCSYRR